MGLDQVGLPSAGRETLVLTEPGYAALGNVGGSLKYLWKNDAPVIVRRIGTDLYEAYSASCAHQGCEVPLPSGNRIKCPCHGATYDADGNRLSGPGSGNLRAGTVSLSGTELTIAFA